MRVLGLDPGIRNTGWAIVDDGVETEAWVVHTGVIQTTKGTMAQKLEQLEQALRLVDCSGVDVVAVETQVRWVGLAVAWAACCGLVGSLYWHPTRVHVSAREAKASLGVAPKAGKPAVKLAVKELLGFDAPSQHEADAAAVAHAAWLRLSR